MHFNLSKRKPLVLWNVTTSSLSSLWKLMSFLSFCPSFPWLWRNCPELFSPFFCCPIVTSTLEYDSLVASCSPLKSVIGALFVGFASNKCSSTICVCLHTVSTTVKVTTITWLKSFRIYHKRYMHKYIHSVCVYIYLCKGQGRLQYSSPDNVFRKNSMAYGVQHEKLRNYDAKLTNIRIRLFLLCSPCLNTAQFLVYYKHK